MPTNIPTITEMFQTLQLSLPALMYAVTGASYVMGIIFFAFGLFGLKKAGGMAQQAHDYKGPVAKIAIGTMLLWLPSIFNAATVTFWGSDSPISYTSSTGSDTDIIIGVLIDVMQLVGIIAFIRGWVLIVKAAEGNAGPGMMSKGITHLIGGLFCYHIYAVFTILETTLGFS